MYNRFKQFAFKNYELVNTLNLFLVFISAFGFALTKIAIIPGIVAGIFAIWLIVNNPNS